MKQQSSKTPPVGDGAYVYDKNGNMIEDKYKKIHISYNYLNLPLQITYKENNFIHFVYSATGEKLQKIVTVEGKVQSKTDYVNGIEYKNDVLQRIAHTEGSLSRQDDDKFLQEYVLRDHLGNTRVTFTDADNDGVVNEKDIKQINHYYCFGLNMEGNWNGAAGTNKRQYNGKEWNDDFGLGWNDHDWRFYDPAIGRFVTIDPESEEDDQEQLNPYHFGLDNPIRYSDPDGRNPIVAGVALYRLYRVVRVGWEIMKAMESVPASSARNMQEISRMQNSLGTIVARDNLVATIKPVMMKKAKDAAEPEPVPIYIDAKKHPESAKHAEEAEKNGTPLTGTIDRKGKDERRKENLKGKATEQNKDRDEMPPAVVKSDGKVSVKNIDKSDNRGAGSSMGHQMRNHPDGTKVKITVKKE